MIYLIEDISTIYCVLSVYQTLLVSKPLGAIGSDVCFRACPVSRWSLSINISSQESIWYLGGLPWFCARLDTFNSVPAAPNNAVTRPKGIRASQGTGMLMTSRILSQLLLSWPTPYLALFGYYMSMVYLNNSEKKNNATGNATTNPPISVPSNTLLLILVPIF